MSDSSSAKADFIKAYFDELDRKIDVLTRLAEAGFKDEALTLCLVYIDGLAQRLMWPSDKSGFNYVAALSQFANDEELGMLHPKQVAGALDDMKPAWHPVAAAVRAAFPGPAYELIPAAAVLSALTGLNAAQISMLQSEMWRGTVAGIAYYWMRNPAVHALGASTLSFDGSTFLGQPAKRLDLSRLQAAAKNLAFEARRRSEVAGEWFGNDAVLA